MRDTQDQAGWTYLRGWAIFDLFEVDNLVEQKNIFQ